MTNVINSPVSVSSYYFAGREMKTFPREIEYAGHEISFMNGLRYLVQKGSEAIKVFDMNGADGLTYRLQQTGDNWLLVGTKGAL